MIEDHVAALGAEPFGLSMGMPAQAVGTELKEITPFRLSTSVVPRPHPTFYRHILWFGPQAGLAKVCALSRRVPTGTNGAGLRVAFAALAAELAVTHGSHRVIDAPVAGYRRCGPHRWLPALVRGECMLAAHWAVEEGSALGQTLRSVTLEADAVGRDGGCLALEYVFANEAQAEAEIEAWTRRGCGLPKPKVQ